MPRGNLPSSTGHKPWNVGKLIEQKPPLKRKDIWAVRVRLQLDERERDLALFNLAIVCRLICTVYLWKISNLAPKLR
jgi:hypothetical protein